MRLTLPASTVVLTAGVIFAFAQSRQPASHNSIVDVISQTDSSNSNAQKPSKVSSETSQSTAEEAASEMYTSDAYSMRPWKSEQLPKPIQLKDCGITVIEWRQSNGFAGTAPSSKAIQVLNDTCVLVFQKFSYFAESNKLKHDSTIGFTQNLCLIPAIRSMGGFDARNLNDSRFRFANRAKSYDINGQINMIWGYTSYDDETMYVRNDVLLENGSVNRKFVVVFAHELFHALSWYAGTIQSYRLTGKNVSETDEKNAQKFTEFLGLGR